MKQFYKGSLIGWLPLVFSTWAEIGMGILRFQNNANKEAPGQDASLPVHFSTVTKSSMSVLPQCQGRRARQAATIADQRRWAPCQRCSWSRGWSSDLRILQLFESTLISWMPSSCFLSFKSLKPRDLVALLDEGDHRNGSWTFKASCYNNHKSQPWQSVVGWMCLFLPIGCLCLPCWCCIN